MYHIPSKWISSALALGLAITPAIAQNANYAPGDLVLYFQQEGGANTVYANLGNAATVFRGNAAGADAPNKINFLDINATLTSAFGSGWASDTSIYAGLAAVANTSATSSVLQNGDPPRTLYVSRSRDAVGTIGTANSAAWSISGDTQMSAGANGIQAQNNKLETVYTDAVVMSPASVSTIDDQNPFLAAHIQAPAFAGAFEGGVQQVGTAGAFGTFGPAGSVHLALDLYRILGKTGVAGQVDGVLRNGSYEGTVTVNSSGQVSFIVQPHYTPGDLVLFFQKAGGSNTVYANLGNAATVFRGAAAGADASNKVNFLDINATLTSAFGAGWASDTSIYAGLAAVANTSATSSVLKDGDPPRTLYVSKPRDAVGVVGTANSAAWSVSGDTQMSAGANGIQAQNNKLATLYTESVVVSPTSDSTIDDQNPFTAPGIQAPAFGGAFEGGVQQVGTAGAFGTFGPAGSVHLALDLYRILGKTGVAGQVDGVLRNGSYEGTVTVNSSGQVSFIVKPHYTPGDLVLFFQKAGGSNTVYANLGNAATVFRGAAAGADASNKVNFLDISATLTSAFGAGWASDTSIYAGLAAVANTSATSSVLKDGDPPRTLYVSKSRDAVGTIGAANSAAWSISGDTQMSAGANGIQAQNNKLATLYTESVVVSPTSVSTIDDQNPFTAPGIQAPAFGGAFEGGVQQVGTAGAFGTFGPAGSVHLALDLYRILGKTGVAGQVGGVLHQGSYEGSITVNSSGLVSFIANIPSNIQTSTNTYVPYATGLTAGTKVWLNSDNDPANTAIRATQRFLGYREVDYKSLVSGQLSLTAVTPTTTVDGNTYDYSAQSATSYLVGFWADKNLPIIIGPDGKAYITDGHHTTAGYLAATVGPRYIIPGNEHVVMGTIAANYYNAAASSHPAPDDAWWLARQSENNTLLYGIDGNQLARVGDAGYAGLQPILPSVQAMPTVPGEAGMADQALRSLAWGMADGIVKSATNSGGTRLKGFSKTNAAGTADTNFVEFYWCDFLRNRITWDNTKTGSALSTANSDRNLIQAPLGFFAAVANGTALAKSEVYHDQYGRSLADYNSGLSSTNTMNWASDSTVSGRLAAAGDTYNMYLLDDSTVQGDITPSLVSQANNMLHIDTTTGQTVGGVIANFGKSVDINKGGSIATKWKDSVFDNATYNSTLTIAPGTGTVTFTGINTYTGPTNIGAGTLALGTTGSILSSSGVTVGVGATFDTTAKSTYAIPAGQMLTIKIDGSGSGSCGRINASGLDISTASVSFNIVNPLDDKVYVIGNYTSRSGSAFASVAVPSGYAINYAYNGNQIALVSSYAGWAAANASGQSADKDTNNNGVPNGVEYFMGSSANPGLVNKTITWPKSSLFIGTYAVEVSSNLKDWVPASTNYAGYIQDNANSLVFTLPSGQAKLFVHLKVLPTP